jgi:BirA family biotin operon repressor/biotin-[acetyl-CoA-carboxylase] ligase
VGISLDTFLVKQITESLGELPSGLSILELDEIDSTNSEAKRRADSESGSLLITARTQTGGRGRMGRSFYSPKDTGIYMSYLYRPKTALSQNIAVTSATAVAVCRALKYFGFDPKIKWVNDIYLGDKKVCGILCESVTNHIGTAVIIGIGVNVSTENFPDEIIDTAVSLGENTDSISLTAKIFTELLSVIDRLETREFISEYKDLSLCLGRKITFIKDGISTVATAIDIDSNGGLIVETDYGTDVLSSGEISVKL